MEALAERGLVGFAFVAAMSYVAPAGGTKPLYGTNQMSFAWPRDGGRPPLVFDQASSAIARGEIMIHQRDGEPLPEAWGIDADGNPTTDPAAALKGAQLPFGGYKGASIALMIELLAGALVGDLFSFEASEVGPGDGGPRAAASSCSQSAPRSAASAPTPSATPRPCSPASPSRTAPASPPTAATRPASAPPPKASPSPEPSTKPSRPSATPDPAGQALKLNAEFAMSERCLTERTGGRYAKL